MSSRVTLLNPDVDNAMPTAGPHGKRKAHLSWLWCSIVAPNSRIPAAATLSIARIFGYNCQCVEQWRWRFEVWTDGYCLKEWWVQTSFRSACTSPPCSVVSDRGKAEYHHLVITRITPVPGWHKLDRVQSKISWLSGNGSWMTCNDIGRFWHMACVLLLRHIARLWIETSHTYFQRTESVPKQYATYCFIHHWRNAAYCFIRHWRLAV